MITEEQKNMFIRHLKYADVAAIKEFILSLSAEEQRQLATVKLEELNFLTPLSFAAHEGYHKIIETLLEIPVVRENAAAEENQVLWCAADENQLEIVKTLLTVDVVKDNAAAGKNLALYCATEMGHHEVVEILLNIPAVRDNAAVEDNQILRVATENGYHEVVKILLNIPAVRNNATAKGNDAFWMAFVFNHEKVVEALLTIDAVAVVTFSEAVGFLYNVGSFVRNIVAANDEGFHKALYDSVHELIKTLLDIPAVRNITAENHNKALIMAVSESDLELVKILLNIPAVRENAAVKNNKALYTATRNNFSEIIKFLLTNKSVQQRLLAFNSRQLLHYIEAFPFMLDEVIDTLSIYGMPLSKLMKIMSQEERLEALKAYIANPLDYLKKEGFSSAVIAAVNIYYTASNKLDVEYDDSHRAPLSQLHCTDARAFIKENMRGLIEEHFRKTLLKIYPQQMNLPLKGDTCRVDADNNPEDSSAKGMQEQKALFDALMMLNSQNASDIIVGNATFSDKAIQLRQAFIHSLDSGSVLNEYRQHFPRVYVYTRDNLNTYISAWLTDIGGAWNLARLREVYKKYRVDSQVLMNPWAWDEHPNLEEQIDRLRMQIEVLLQRTCLRKNAMQIATQMATLLLEQKTDDAIEIIREKITDEDECSSVMKEIKEIVNELPETRREKSALWDKLYRLLNEKALLSNENIESLRMIVHSIIADKLPLKEAMALHFSAETIQQLTQKDEPIVFNFLRKRERDAIADDLENVDSLKRRKRV